jgi:hypothetical protein
MTPEAAAAPAVETPPAFVERVGREYVAFLTRTRRPPAAHPDRVYASQCRDCERQMVYELTVPERAPMWSPELLAKFRFGDDREANVLADLAKIGRDATPPFRVINQQERFTVRDRRGRTALVGKVDARVEVGGRLVPIELKAWSPYVVDRLAVFDDCLDNPWTRAGAFQLLAYMLAAGEPWGILLLDRSGIPKLLPVELNDANLERAESFLAKAERVLDHIEAETMPDYLDDPATCRRCAFFGHTCNPPTLTAAPLILDDPELETALARRDAIKAVGEEYAHLDRDLKDRLRGVERALVGKFAISGTWSKSSRVELPAELKRQYTTTDPHGRFTLTIERLP